MRITLPLIVLATQIAVGAQQPAAPSPATPPVMVGQKDGFFTTKDGVKIHYLTHGPSTPLGAGNSGSWVVLVHGYSDNAQRMWFNTGIAPEIAKRHRVVAIDNAITAKATSRSPAGLAAPRT